MTPKSEIERRAAFRAFLWELDRRQCRICHRDVHLETTETLAIAQVYTAFVSDDKYDPLASLILCPTCHHLASSRAVALTFGDDAKKCRGPLEWKGLPPDAE